MPLFVGQVYNRFITGPENSIGQITNLHHQITNLPRVMATGDLAAVLQEQWARLAHRSVPGVCRTYLLPARVPLHLVQNTVRRLR